MKITKQYWQWLILLVVLVPFTVLMAQGLVTSDFSDFTRGSLALFPYLGIMAWLVMWTHYAAGFLRHINPKLEYSSAYSRVSHLLVTVLIVAHPALLAFSQYELSGLTPPQSFENYVGPAAMMAVTAGLVALAIFLFYDVYRLLRSSQFWKRQQWLVAISQSLAMSLIFWHGLRLGQNLNSGWFRTWWIILGLFLVVGQYSDIKRALDGRKTINK